MQPIKFRADVGGKMLYRDLCDRNWYNSEDKQVREALPEDRNWEIVQYTTCNDADGKEIYAGDKVGLYSGDAKQPRCTGTIVWEYAQWYIEFEKGGKRNLANACHLDKVRVQA